MYNIKYTWFYSTFLQPRISTGSTIFQCFHLFSPFLYSAPWRGGVLRLIYLSVKLDAYVFKFCLSIAAQAEPFYIRRIPIIHIFPQTYYTELFFKKAIFIICICIFRYNIICSVATGSAQLRGAYAWIRLRVRSCCCDGRLPRQVTMGPQRLGWLLTRRRF